MHVAFYYALLACLLSDWTTTTGRLHDLSACLPHKDGGIPLSVFLKGTTSRLTGLFFTLSLFNAEHQAGKL